MLVGIFSKNRFCVELKKFADHPVTVCGDPDCNGKIVAELTYVLPRSPGNDDRYDEGREDHCNTQWLPDHTPTDIFKKPEDNVEVFHLAVAKRNGISLLGRHIC
jgi:hypothetical protein